MEALKGIGSLLLWGLLLFAQHVVSFDMFDTNFCYLHLLALTLAAGQGALLWANRNRRSALLACGWAYAVVSVLKLPISLALLTTGGWRADTTCQLLDLSGAAWCFWLIKRKNNKVKV